MPLQALFVHGFAGAPAMWDPVVAELDPEDVVVHRAVLPGHGRAPSGMEGDFETAVTSLLASVPARPLVVTGYSLGGRLALGMAARDAEVVPLLIGAHPGLDTDAERTARQSWEAQQAAAIRELGVSRFMERWRELPIFASQTRLPHEARKMQHQWRTSHTAPGLAWAMETLGLGRMPSYRTSCRGTWLTGSLDEKFTRLCEGLAAGAEGRLDHQVVEGAGHNVVLEAPRAVVNAWRHMAASVSP